MDAKNKANFINSIAGEQEDTKASEAPAFASVDESTNSSNTETKDAEVKVVTRYIEPESVFAQGLPEWSIEPPQVMVRRR